MARKSTKAAEEPIQHTSDSRSLANVESEATQVLRMREERHRQLERSVVSFQFGIISSHWVNIYKKFESYDPNGFDRRRIEEVRFPFETFERRFCEFMLGPRFGGRNQVLAATYALLNLLPDFKFQPVPYLKDPALATDKDLDIVDLEETIPDLLVIINDGLDADSESAKRFQNGGMRPIPKYKLPIFQCKGDYDLCKEHAMKSKWELIQCSILFAGCVAERIIPFVQRDPPKSKDKGDKEL